MMQKPLTFWQRVLDLLGFYVPAEVTKDMPRTLDEYRQQRRARMESGS